MSEGPAIDAAIDAGIDELARHPDPAAVHAELRRRGPHRTADGRWVVAGADDVAQVLGSPLARIGFAADPARPVTAWQARMARFTDGAEHAPRRAAARSLLDGLDPARLRLDAATATNARVAGAVELDAMGPARQVPVAVLAAALGVDDPVAAVVAVAELAAALAPRLDVTPPAADTAVAALCDLLAHLPGDPVAGTGLLFQAYDATAALVGGAAARLDGAAVEVDELIATTLRGDGPVQLTTRVADAGLEVGGHDVPAGDRVVVVLAAAGTDPDDPGRRSFAFGTGPHACPGSQVALALAAGVLDALVAAGAAAVGPVAAHQPRLNLRVPIEVRLRLGAAPDRRPLSGAPSGSRRRAGSPRR
jgi:cytochrome P450